jgi:hypothetical protein
MIAGQNSFWPGTCLRTPDKAGEIPGSDWTAPCSFVNPPEGETTICSCFVAHTDMDSQPNSG